MARGLKVKIGADSAQFDRTMKNVRGKLDSIKGPIKSAGVAAAAAGAAVAGLGVGVGLLIRSASREAAGIESLSMQFETLLGSAEKAQARMEEITDFAATTPFEIKELAGTSKLLQTLGGEMLATGKGLRMVGDAAAIAGQPIGEVGLHIGRIFNAITSGTTAGESVSRLQELGLITGNVKRQFENLGEAQKSGQVAALSQQKAMELLRGVLSNTEGAMERLASTTEGKLSNMSDNISQLKVAFGTGFNDGLKAALDATNEFLPKLLDIFKKMGEAIGNALSDAIAGDTEKLKAIGSFIGTVIAESAKAAGKIGLRGFGAQVLGGIQGAENFIRETTRLDKLMGKADIGTRAQEAAGVMASRDFDIAIKNATIALQEMTRITSQPGIGAGPAPAGFRLAGEGESSVFRDQLGRMVIKLEEISRNTRPQAFPTQ